MLLLLFSYRSQLGDSQECGTGEGDVAVIHWLAVMYLLTAQLFSAGSPARAWMKDEEEYLTASRVISLLCKWVLYTNVNVKSIHYSGGVMEQCDMRVINLAAVVLYGSSDISSMHPLHYRHL